MLFTTAFNSFISFNDSLPSSYSYGGPGTCYNAYNIVPSTGIKTLDCTYRNYQQVIGRYVTVMPYGGLPQVFTICEVTVNGVRQNIAADGNY